MSPAPTATAATAATFMAKPRFAVVGASNDESKFGFKVFAWYHDHSLPASPINPKGITILSTPSAKTLSELAQAKSTDLSSFGISIITPPKITLSVLDEAQKLGAKAVWLQPGTWDDAVLEKLGEFETAVWGDGGGGHEGWCVLVDGERALADGRKEGKLARL